MLTRQALMPVAALLLAVAGIPSTHAQTAPPPGAPVAPSKAPAPGHKHAAKRPAGDKGVPVYHLLGFSLGGSKRINADAIVATLPQHEGDVITEAEIKDDADRLKTILKARHIHGDLTTATLEKEEVKGHQIWVIYDIQLRDVLSDVPLRNPRHFASQTFSGNAKLTTEQLTAITGLHAGGLMKDGTLSDVRTAIEQAYDTALPGVPVQVRGKVKLRKDDTIVILWQINEKPADAPHP